MVEVTDRRARDCYSLQTTTISQQQTDRQTDRQTDNLTVLTLVTNTQLYSPNTWQIENRNTNLKNQHK